ncbi:DUF4124 domain-containing protein [Methylobacter svalbardensis]|uniref:DUF4124 domain-containing protein n=1 Tax=Methylobacter svalbardensis TaxID=3080016 RepID=UPI0030EB9409
MKIIFFILLPLLSLSAQAEVFKCQLPSGKTVYQSTPCKSAVKQQAIEIEKSDPRKVAEREAKLKTWKEDFAKREQARIKAEQERQAELDRKAAVEALKKSEGYQKQQAYEAKRWADALERQNMQPLYQPYQYFPSFPLYRFLPTYPSYPYHVPHHRHNRKEKDVTDTHQSEQRELKNRINTDADKYSGPHCPDK